MRSFKIQAEPCPLIGNYEPVRGRSPYMYKYEQRVVKGMRHEDIASFESNMKFCDALFEIWFKHFRPVFKDIDRESIRQALVPRFHCATFLENKGKTGSTKKTSFSRNILKFMTRDWGKYTGKEPAKQPLHRLIGWPWEFSLGRSINIAATAYLTSAYTAHPEVRPEQIIPIIAKHFGPIVTTYLHRYSDGAGTNYVGVGFQTGSSGDTEWKADKWVVGERLNTKPRAVKAIPKGVSSYNKPSSAYLKAGFAKMPQMNSDRFYQRTWAKDALTDMRRNHASVLSNDMVNYDAGMLGWNSTSQMFSIIEELTGLPKSNIALEMGIPSYMPYNGIWVQTSGDDGLSSGSTFTSDIGKGLAGERLLKMGFYLKKCQDKEFTTGEALDAYIDSLPYSLVESVLLQNESTKEYSFLDLSDDCCTRTNLVKDASVIEDPKQRATYTAEYLSKKYWALYAATLSTEPGLTFLGQVFTDSNFNDNPYQGEFKSIGRLIVKILVDEDPKLGKLAIVSLAARMLQITENMPTFRDIVYRVFKACKESVSLLVAYMKMPGVRLRVRSYAYLDAVGNAAAVLLRHASKGSVDDIKKLMIITAQEAVKEEDGNMMINALLQTFLRGEDDVDLLPDELKSLMPFLYADVSEFRDMKIFDRTDLQIEEVKYIAGKMQELLRYKNGNAQVFITEATKGIMDITLYLANRKHIVFSPGFAAA